MDRNWDVLHDFCQTDDERAVVKFARAKPGDVNEVGTRILRRIAARTPAMRAKLNGYNKTYSVRKRRIAKGEWPENVPTASALVKAGLLSQEDAHDTKAYVKAVTIFLNPTVYVKSPIRQRARCYGDATIIYVNTDALGTTSQERSAEVETPDSVVVSKVSRSPKPRSGRAKIVRGDYVAADKPDQVDVGQTLDYLKWQLRHIQQDIAEALDAAQKAAWEHIKQTKIT